MPQRLSAHRTATYMHRGDARLEWKLKHTQWNKTLGTTSVTRAHADNFLYIAIPCALRDASIWPSAVRRTTATHCLHCKASCAQAQKHTPAQPHPSRVQDFGGGQGI